MHKLQTIPAANQTAEAREPCRVDAVTAVPAYLAASALTAMYNDMRPVP